MRYDSRIEEDYDFCSRTIIINRKTGRRMIDIVAADDSTGQVVVYGIGCSYLFSAIADIELVTFPPGDFTGCIGDENGEYDWPDSLARDKSKIVQNPIIQAEKLRKEPYPVFCYFEKHYKCEDMEA